MGAGTVSVLVTLESPVTSLVLAIWVNREV